MKRLILLLLVLFMLVNIPNQLEVIARKWSYHYGVDPKLVFAMITQESGWQPDIMSEQGAMGLMQVTEGAFLDCGVDLSEDLFDPEINISCGVQYLARVCQVNDSLVKALACYNGGPTLLDKAYEAYPAETQRYIVKVLWLYQRDDFL